MRKIIAIGIAALAIVAGGLVLLQIRPQPPNQSTKNVDTPTSTPQPSAGQLSTGRYSEFSTDIIAAPGYNETILFFYAAWCPECRAYDTVLRSATLPVGTQIIKVDYDSATDLRKRYGVTLQTTFVKVTSGGEKLSAWPAYGKEKSVQAILDNT